MEYAVKNKNYCTFRIFEKNKLPPRSYFIPFSDRERAVSASVINARYVSDCVECLSGEWDFCFFKNPNHLGEVFDTEQADFDKITVPSVWQYTGYLAPLYLNCYQPFCFDPPQIPEDKQLGIYKLAFNRPFHRIDARGEYNSVGVYRKIFSVKDKNKRYIISFLGVAPCFDLYLNGQFIGYSEGSHNTAEFVLDDMVEEGENELLVVVRRFSTGTYLEAQDMFRNCGIFRDVLLYVTDKTHVLDYEIRTIYKDGTYSLYMEIIAENGSGRDVFVDFMGKTYTGKCDKEGRARFCAENLEVTEWSAEIPTLYSVVINFDNKEFIAEKIGFRNIKIIGDTFYLNGKKLKLFGVNHHDAHPENGYVLSVEDMEKDVRLMKEYNVNAVRTAHYPPDPIFLRLCAEYGLYVIEEADIETHAARACGDFDYISKDEKWKEHYLDRVKRMYMRDRNVCAVVLWSLGNESGGLVCQRYCYDYLKKLTDTPLHYHWVRKEEDVGFDVLSEMYTSIETMKKNAESRSHNPKRRLPYLLCEYAHSMGVGPGALEEYVELFLSDDVYMGGCAWEWCDHAVYHPENGNYTYGGDHNEYIHNGWGCIDGLFTPDRKPYTSAFSMKTAYRPIRMKHLGEGKIEFKNINRFLSSESVKIVLKLFTDGKAEWEKEADISLPPEGVSYLTVEYPPDKDVFLTASYFDKKTGREIASEQMCLHEKIPTVSFKKGETYVETSADSFILRADRVRMVFDRKKGGILSYRIDDEEVVDRSVPNERNVPGIYTDLYRAPLQNDRRINEKEWAKIGLDKYRPHFVRSSVIKDEDGCRIVFKYSLFARLRPVASMTDTYMIGAEGRMLVQSEMTPYFETMLPRFGKVVVLKKDLDRVSYYGRGEKENYPDMKSQSTMGIYHAEGDFGVRMIVPQNSGERCDVRWAEIVNKRNIGLRFEAVNDPFGLNVNHYDEKRLSSWRHIVDYKDADATYVNIDGFLCGVGSASCGPPPELCYQIPKRKKLSFSFQIVPIFR